MDKIREAAEKEVEKLIKKAKDDICRTHPDLQTDTPEKDLLELFLSRFTTVLESRDRRIAELQACHEAELGVCHQHCDEVKAQKKYVGTWGDCVIFKGNTLMENMSDAVDQILELREALTEADRKAREDCAEIADNHEGVKYTSGTPCGCSWEIACAIRDSMKGGE